MAVRGLREADGVLVPVLAGPDPEPGRAETVIREYVAADMSGGQPWLARAGVAVRFFPWMLTHLLAIPLTLGQLRDGFRKQRRELELREHIVQRDVPVAGDHPALSALAGRQQRRPHVRKG